MKMKMNSNTVWVFLLFLVLTKMICCQGCWEHEREALLALNAQFDSPLPWVDSSDCCQWAEVECNDTTRRVAKLDLSFVMHVDRPGNWYINYSDFLVLKDLKSLDLSYNSIAGCVQDEGLRLSNLEVIDFRCNSLNNTASILPCLDGLSSLKSLNLSDNRLNETLLHVLEALSSKLLNLEALDIGDNNFNGSDVASSLSGLSSLKYLSLQFSQLTPRSIHGNATLCISNLRYLETLALAGNFFTNDSTQWHLGGLQHLKYLDLSNCHLEGSLNISGLLGLSNLEILDLSYNGINNFVGDQGSKSLRKLEVLKLDENKMDGNMLGKSLRGFSSIMELYLNDNEFEGIVVAADFRDLDNLEHLFLDFSQNLVDEFFKSIGLLTSLKVLSLGGCRINGTLPAADWSKLKKLEELYLSSNEFEGTLPSSFCNMTSLRYLELYSNNFIGNFGSNIASLTSLEYLDFEGNQFEVPISFAPFANHSKLKFIRGDGNKVILDLHPTLQTWVPNFQLQEMHLSSTTETNSLPLPNFLLYQYNLTDLEFTGLKLEGEFPSWLLANNTKLTDLVLADCSFTGTFQLPSHPLLRLQNIDVSNNAITGQIPNNNISSIFPNLQYLDMSVNHIHGSIPHAFGEMSLLEKLDLSDNNLFGEIPKNIYVIRSLRLLRLSNNNLDGTVLPTLSAYTHLENLFLDGNSLSGSIPSSFFDGPPSLSEIDLSNNQFVGNLPSCGIDNLPSLKALFMSNNHFEGSIPSDFAKHASYLDLSQNKLTGSVPSFLNSPLKFIHLSNNKLSGLPTRMFGEGSPIVMLDFSYNHITSSIQDMIQGLSHTSLNILLLKGNYFTGPIPEQLCQLINITILDLSHNNFSGPIPNCMGKMPFENKAPMEFQILLNGSSAFRHTAVTNCTRYRGPCFDNGAGPYGTPGRYGLFVKEKANFTTKKNSYTYTGSVLAYMSGIDLSYNKLNGNIPAELGNLTKIRAMNLSYNDLSGKIPAKFSNLAQIESLDLSFNNLSGSIPPRLNELTSLAVFSVAHNNLSGATPERKGQFLTFEESSYEGNPFLCGPPLPKSCSPYGQLPNSSYTDGDNGNLVDIYVFCVSFAVSYISVLLVIAIVLYINPYWRRVWFYYIELVSTSCYYFIEDNLRKFSINIGNM